MKTYIISLGGSLIVPEKINADYLKKVKDLFEKIAEENKVVLVCGGGMICRDYVAAAREIATIDDTEADWIGIMATRLNAELVRAIFGEKAYGKVIHNPTKKIDTDKNIIIGSGWEPGCSSDLDAVLLALNFGAQTVINLTNTDYVYDDDPKKNPDAKPLEKVSWDDFLSIIGEEWKPAANYPFDPIASKKARDNKIKVIIANGNNLENLQKIFDDEEFIGTEIF